MNNLQNLSLRALKNNADKRGVLTEIFRNEWLDSPLPVQWNFVRTKANVLRGVHVHVRHIDYLVVLSGTMQLGTCDLREGTPNFMESKLHRLSGSQLTFVTTPTGIAHGFYFPEATDFIYSVTHYWDPIDDELGCMWNDPGLNLDWPVKEPMLSARDQQALTLDELLAKVRNRVDKSW